MAEYGRLIDADALKDRLQALADDDWNQGIPIPYADALNEVVDMLDDAPTIEPERKKGKWIKLSPAKIYECSKCKQNVMTDDICCYRFCHN